MEYCAVVIKKYGNRRLHDTAREHGSRLATASGQPPVSWTCGRHSEVIRPDFRFLSSRIADS